jgi:uroporphyrinogen-III synthase
MLESALSELSSAATAEGGAEGASGDRATAVGALEARLAMLEAQLPEPAAAQQTADQIAALEQRLTAAEEAGGQASQLAGTVDVVRTAVQTSLVRIAGVGDLVPAGRDRIDEVAGNVQALDQRVTTLQDRVDSSENRRERAATLALLTTQLDAALNESRSYDRLLATLAEVAKDDPAVEDAVGKLRPAAETGVPDLTVLRQRFAETANEIVHQANAPEGDGLIDRATDNLMRLVTVRPVGADAEGDSAAARVARAEAKLAQGDLAGAVAELEQLQGAPAEAAAEWLEMARMRLDAEDAVTSLQAHTTAMLTEAQ